MSELNVRLATPEDEDALLDLAVRAWAENGILDVNREKMRGMIRPALYLWQGLCGVIGDPGQPIEGAVLLRVSQMWYSDVRRPGVSSKEGWSVEPVRWSRPPPSRILQAGCGQLKHSSHHRGVVEH